MHAVWVVVLLAAVFLVSRYVLRPDRHSWQVWIPTVVALVAIAAGLAFGDWQLAALFAVVLPIEVWRTLPVWRGLRANQ